MATLNPKVDKWFEVAVEALYFNGRTYRNGEFVCLREVDDRLTRLLFLGKLVVPIVQHMAA
jgi:hypothetical protein